ncbi:MAG: hypothetical protein KKE23_02400 [Nanoarchaeota archaeon]|nr:hypothetical protein [Nanoarchaeota archaeon]
MAFKKEFKRNFNINFGRRKFGTSIKQKIIRRMKPLGEKEMMNGKFLVDTSAIINKKVSSLAKKGLKGLILVPNATIAELENLANRGQDVGFEGLEEIAKLHHFKNLKIHFIGSRPTEHHIKYAKSGEIDALIRNLAYENRAILITSDVVQAKSAEAYGLKVLFVKTRQEKPKRRFLFFNK